LAGNKAKTIIPIIGGVIAVGIFAYLFMDAQRNVQTASAELEAAAANAINVCSSLNNPDARCDAMMRDVQTMCREGKIKQACSDERLLIYFAR
jgi:hypothetical protein